MHAPDDGVLPGKACGYQAESVYMDGELMVRARGRMYSIEQARRSLFLPKNLLMIGVGGSAIAAMISLVFVRGDMSFGLVALFAAALFSAVTFHGELKKDAEGVGGDIGSLRAHCKAKLLKLKNETYIFLGSAALILALGAMIGSSGVILSMMFWFASAFVMVLELIKMRDIASDDSQIVQVTPVVIEK
jgi:hypothetical protein